MNENWPGFCVFSFAVLRGIFVCRNKLIININIAFCHSRVLSVLCVVIGIGWQSSNHHFMIEWSKSNMRDNLFNLEHRQFECECVRAYIVWRQKLFLFSFSVCLFQSYSFHSIFSLFVFFFCHLKMVFLFFKQDHNSNSFWMMWLPYTCC